MEILKVFIKFINEILSYEIFGIQLITYLLTFTMTVIIFKIISVVGNHNNKAKKESSDKQ